MIDTNCLRDPIKIIKDSNVLIIGQHLTSRTEAVRDYLLPRVNRLFIIALGGVFLDEKENRLFYYEYGNLKQRFTLRHPFLKRKIPDKLLIPVTFFFYLCDIFRALFIFKRRFDLFIGISHFSGLVGVLLKSGGICSKNIYYAIDYYALHQGLSRIDQIFVKVENFADKVAVLYSDRVWDISPRIREARFEFGGLKKERYSDKNKIVPLGYSKFFFKHKDVQDIDRYAIVFVGIIIEGQGLELMLEALPEIIKIIPQLKVGIVGTGPFLAKFREMVLAKKMESVFKFYGFIESEEEMLDIISSSAVGISLWDNRNNRFLNSYFGDPGKTKLYSVCGLPVVVNNSTVYSQIIMRNKAGIAINYNRKELIDALLNILLDEKVYLDYKTNAIVTALEYCDSEKIFSSILDN